MSSALTITAALLSCLRELPHSHINDATTCLLIGPHDRPIGSILPSMNEISTESVC